MKRQRIIHPEHPCIICGKPTTNKNYCDFHETLYTRPRLSRFKSTFNISAEPETSNIYKRLENVNKSI